MSKSSQAPSVEGFPAGAATIERVGLEDDPDGGPERFTALLVFPNGAPDLTAAVVWKNIPVRIVIDPTITSPPDIGSPPGETTKSER